MATKRLRKANYSQEENLFLADKYEEFKDVLDAKHKDVNTNKKKRDTWAAILSQHHGRFPQVERSLDDLKARLSKLKSESRECLLVMKKSKKATGGGKPPKEPNPAQQKILDLCEDTPGFKGLTGVESGVVPTAREIFLETGEGDDVEEQTVEEEGLTEEETSKSFENFISPSKKRKKDYKSFEELVDIERSNALIKQENLLLKQEKLKLEIELLKCKVGQSTVQNEAGKFFTL